MLLNPVNELQATYKKASVMSSFFECLASLAERTADPDKIACARAIDASLRSR